MGSSVKSSNQGSTQLEPLQQQHHHHHRHHHHQIQQEHQISFGMMQSPSSSSSIIPGNLLNKDSGGSGAYDLGELDQALFLYLDGQADPSNTLHQDQRQKSSSSGMRPHTLNIFPSQPMHVHPSSSNSKASMELVSASKNEPASATAPPPQPPKPVKRDSNRKGPTSSSEQEGPKTPDPKTLRRLAQNREAARKSRLRKKAYVQQLESSRIRLNQIEQELQRARSQGIFFGGSGVMGGEQGLGVGINGISTEAAMFDVEYARWLEEHHRLVCELRAAVQEHLPENELRLFVDNCLAHYDQVMNLKGLVARSDVFHLVSGMWKTPAERCFMWIGGFRPSELIKIMVSQIEPLTEQQILGICGLQQSTQEAEEALSQGLEALNQSLLNTITSDSLSSPPVMATYMGQMALAMNKLATLEDFVKQADNLRQQTVHRLHEILTTRQAARCFLAIAEYFHRLRALSSLWLSRPRQDQ
ncbi:bZIP transcription factor TGA10-like isoform X2 [Arachis stenosperma]|uniref:bZIP transcription factor TGA10-like isoform X2 n=1 Tax=Arachis stenosperma TaxID=217475 RepID=UPI0025ACD9D8|nr:bZIP transcription factor TGA10-like isoform X2 [Arachis stenosperma]